MTSAPIPLISPDLWRVGETAKELLLTDLLPAVHLWAPDETPSLVSEVVRELCEQRVQELRLFAEEFSLLSGAGCGWRRGQDGDSSNNSTLVSLGSFLWSQLLALTPYSPDRLPQAVVAHHEFHTRLWFYVRSPPPDLSKQHSLIDADTDTGSGRFLISCRWYDKWVALTNMGDGKKSGAKLGPIDNSSLREEGWKLRRSLLHSLTVGIIGGREWSCLLSWYGLAQGSMVVCGHNELGLELYPITILSCVHGAPPSLYRRVSVGSNQPLNELVEKVKYQYGVAREKESRLFVYFNRNSFYRVQDLSELASVRLFNGQIVQLQLQLADGTWEERNDVIDRNDFFF